MLESLIADKSGGKRTLRKDIDGQYLMQIDQFHKTSFYWNYLLSFSGISMISFRVRQNILNFGCRIFTRMLRFVSIVVSRVLFGNDDGQTNQCKFFYKVLFFN